MEFCKKQTEKNANIKSWVFQHRDRGNCYFLIGGDLQTDRGNTYILIKCPSTNKSFREMLISEQASPTKDGIYANQCFERFATGWMYTGGLFTMSFYVEKHEKFDKINCYRSKHACNYSRHRNIMMGSKLIIKCQSEVRVDIW